MSNAILDAGDLTTNKSSKVLVSTEPIFLLEKMGNKCVDTSCINKCYKGRVKQAKGTKYGVVLLLYKGKVVD